METLSLELKNSTMKSHREIEAVKPFKNLMGPAFTLEEYQNIIMSWYYFIKPLETRFESIDGLLEVLPDLNERLKTFLLIEDLKALEQSVNYDFTPEYLPKCETIEDALGIIYVIEGSTLGSQFISKKLAGHDFINESNTKYYNGYKNKTGSYWNAFKSKIDNWGIQNEIKKTDVVKSAISCFDNLALHMNSYYDKKEKAPIIEA